MRNLGAIACKNVANMKKKNKIIPTGVQRVKEIVPNVANKLKKLL